MTDNKLFELLNLLTPVEKRECTAFIKSPYHNQREDVRQLWEMTLGDRGRIPVSHFEKAAFSRIYPDQPFDAARWRHLQSMLLGCVEAFLAQRAFEKTPLLADLHLAPVYRRKNLRKPLEHVLRRAGERLEKMPRDASYYLHLYHLELERFAATESQVRTRENNLAAVGRAFDIYLLANKLRLACLMESHRAVFKAEYDTTFLPELLRFLAGNPLLEVPLVALYYYCHQSLTEGGEADFRAFRSQLESQSLALPPDESRTLLLLAINYCIRRLNTGENRYVREAFELYRIGLESGALLENGHLSRFAFKNMVALGLHLEAFGWVAQFIGQYEPFLEEKYRAAHRDYNLAKLFFAQKDYRNAMPLLARVDESDLLLNLDSRVLLLKMYYETGEWDALDALLSSFKILLLRKKKVIGYHSTHYLNTLRYIRKLSRLNHNDKQAVALFKSEVGANKSVIEQEWLLRMV